MPLFLACGERLGGEDCPRMWRWLWVNTEQTLRMKISGLRCSFLGANALPAGAQPWQAAGISTLSDRASCFGAMPDWLVTAISCHQPNPLSCIFMSGVSNCSSLFLSWCMVHGAAVPSCSPIINIFFSPAAPLALSIVPGCLLPFYLTFVFLLT